MLMALRSRTREKMIAALLEHGSVTDASQALNISRASIHRSLLEEDFKRELKEARRALVDRAITKLERYCADAVEILKEVMSDTEAHPGTRASAATRLLDFAIKTSEIAELISRIEALEKRLK